MSGRWNSSHAIVYHCGVKPAGSQVLNQRVPNEFTTTLPIIASRLTMKNTTTAQTAIDHSFSLRLRCIDAQPLPVLAGPRNTSVRAPSSATMMITCTPAISIAIAEASE